MQVRAWGLERGPFLPRKKPESFQGLEQSRLCRTGLGGSSTVHLLSLCSSWGCRSPSLAAPLHLSARASSSLQRPTPPQPHWQSRFEACQPLVCLHHEHGTRHVLAALAHRRPLADSSLTPCSFSKHPPVPGPCPSSCQAGLRVWSCLRLAHGSVHVSVVRGSPGHARQWQESTVVGTFVVGLRPVTLHLVGPGRTHSSIPPSLPPFHKCSLSPTMCQTVLEAGDTAENQPHKSPALAEVACSVGRQTLQIRKVRMSVRGRGEPWSSAKPGRGWRAGRGV